jgi:hypothetical protein
MEFRSFDYISPSRLMMYEADKDAFYVNYLSTVRHLREPQNYHMAIGSAFDAYVKAYLHERIFGKGYDPKYDLLTLFETQVEPAHRVFCWEHGKYLFEQYKKYGVLSDLLSEIMRGSDPRFEVEIKGVIGGTRESTISHVGPLDKLSHAEHAQEDSMILLGRPDVCFRTAARTLVVLDFKVNGYFSVASPKSGYIRLRPSSLRQRMVGTHMMVDGIVVNIEYPLETVEKSWATQLSIYGWLCGEPIGSQFITAIDQICGMGIDGDPNKKLLYKAGGNPERPEIKIAEHRCQIGKAYQASVYNRCERLWEIVKSGWLFRDMSPDDSDKRCRLLDTYTETVAHDASWSELMS